MKCFSAPANLNSCFTITKGKFHKLHFRITPSNYRDQVPEEWRAIQKKWKKFDEISFDWFCLTEPIVWEKIRKIRIKNDLFFFYWEHSHIVQVRSVCRPDLPQLRAVLLSMDIQNENTSRSHSGFYDDKQYQEISGRVKNDLNVT